MSRQYMNGRWCVRCGRKGMTPALRDWLKHLKTLLDDRDASSLTVVDVGCGNGRNMNGLLQLGFDENKMKGYDMCPNAGSAAVKLTLGHDDFPEPDASVDMFLANYILMFLDDAEIDKVISEINRTAAAGAVVMVELYPAKDSRIKTKKEMLDFQDDLIKRFMLSQGDWTVPRRVQGKFIMHLIRKS